MMMMVAVDSMMVMRVMLIMVTMVVVHVLSPKFGAIKRKTNYKPPTQTLCPRISPKSKDQKTKQIKEIKKKQS
jgi:hypothetical protein